MLNPVFHVSHMRSMTPIFYRISCTVSKSTSHVTLLVFTDEFRQLRDTIKKELEGQGGVGETDILTWMHRCALELVGQGGLGYSFDPRMEGQQNEYASALKQFLSVHLPFWLLRSFRLNYSPFADRLYFLFLWLGLYCTSSDQWLTSCQRLGNDGRWITFRPDEFRE